MTHGQFIVIEGVRGSGKSTLIRRVQEQIPDIVHVEDFGTLDFCERMRDDFLNPDRPWAARMAMAYASKSYLQEKVIRPNLEAGNDVLCERWWQSIEAYLLYPHGHDADVAQKANDLFGILEPDLTVICTVNLETAIQRVKASGREANVFEERGEEFMREVCTYYAEVCDGVVADSTEDRLDVVLREMGVR